MVVGLVVLGSIGASLLAPGGPPAGAAGMTTHAWMAESAIDLVEDGDLAALLEANVAQVRSGARFPDGGYGPGNVYGEEAHWQRFTDVYAEIIREKETCGDLTAPTGPCAAQIAHLMGIVAHGTGDEVWDWLFEPNSPDLDEYYLPDELSAFQDGGGQELVMDLVAIGVHHRPGGAPPALPNEADLLAAFAASGQQGVTAEQLDFGQQYIDIVYAAESSWVPAHLPGVLRNMPWMSNNMVSGPGGVEYAARAIAGQWDDMWQRLLGEDPTTVVSATYPADQQRRIPATGWERSFAPGSHPDRGGARTRISASLTYALPYRHPGGEPAPEQLPPGSMTLTDVDHDAAVPLMAGYPRVVPYGPDAGTHTVALQPAEDLTPCTWYRVDVTEALLDADGDGVTPTSWEFRTGTDADGGRCEDDPYTADELWIRAAYQDVLDRTAGAGELASWTDSRARGLTNGRFAANLVGSAEGRDRTARLLYTGLLGRQAGPGERAYWAGVLRTATLPTVVGRIVATPEFAALGEGDPDHLVALLYTTLLGREPGPGEYGYWRSSTVAGTTRGTMAKKLMASPEGLRYVVVDVYGDLLGREPGPGEVAYWTAQVKRTDERFLVRSIVASAEYVQHVTE